MTPLLDAHAHLCDPCFDADRDEVLARARAAGVDAIVAVGETLADARRNLELARRHPGVVLPAIGLYPEHLDVAQAEAVEQLAREQRDRLVAIGEVGLDFWKVRDEAGRAVQREIFARSIALALELDLPLNVHSRSTGREVVSMLLESGARRVLLHAFDGKPSTARMAFEAGYFFSIPPSVVRSRQKQKLARSLPLSALLLETDSPVLGPVADQRNEPANLWIALAALAELRGIAEEVLLAAVRENASRLFSLRA